MSLVKFRQRGKSSCILRELCIYSVYVFCICILYYVSFSRPKGNQHWKVLVVPEKVQGCCQLLGGLMNPLPKVYGK